jgi:hypothetical protein
MPKNNLFRQVAFLSGHLVPHPKSNASLKELELSLVENLEEETLEYALPDPFSFEYAEPFSVAALEANRSFDIAKTIRQSRRRRKKEQGEETRYRVFRRDQPLSSSLLKGSMPSWANGAKAARSMGPFIGKDGRKFWFDFFEIIKLVPLYIDGESTPAMLLYLPINSFLQNQDDYSLRAGSIWIRGNLFSNAVPGDLYTGLSISGGSIQVDGSLTQDHAHLVLSGATSVRFTLNLQEAELASAPASQFGKDALAAAVDLPDTLTFSLQTSGISLEEIDAASWTVYGDTNNFSWEETQAPAYRPAINRILIPFSGEKPDFQVGTVSSAFFRPEGTCNLVQSGWLLPLAAIDINSPTPAAGIGGFAIQGDSGLSVTWRGLGTEKIHLNEPWVAYEGGLLGVSDLLAGNSLARQQYELWKQEETGYPSVLELRYTDAFPLVFLSHYAGTELLTVTTDAEARIDRPVDVTGRPLEIKTKDSRLVLALTDLFQLLSFYDDNILFDNLDFDQDTIEFPDPVSLAIRNALFKITPVNGCLLFGELADARTVEKGIVFLTFGLYNILPTLPDPYVSNTKGILARNQISDNIDLPGMLLIGAVNWGETPWDPDQNPDTIDTAFHFAPLVQPTSSAERMVQPLKLNPVSPAMVAEIGIGVINAADEEEDVPDPIDLEQYTTTYQFGKKEVEYVNYPAIWNDFFRFLNNDQFALVDVSSNADQMGVSFGYLPGDRFFESNQHVFVKTHIVEEEKDYQPSGFPLQVEGMDLSASARFVRAYTVPQVSWEPLLNLTPPAVFGDPPPLWNLYPDDGGPTRISSISKELVPLAPLPLTDFLVRDFQENPNSVIWSLFTLPFGMKSFALLEKLNGKAVKEGTDLSLNQPEFEGELKGGLQLQAMGGESNPGEKNTFKGATLQLNNVLTAQGIATLASTLGYSVTKIFNGEFMVPHGISNRGVPVVRMDFSGYGANTFSDWQNENAAIAQTSQARFDIFNGRTAHEVIQVKSLVYPWGIRVVRTITIFRVRTGFVYRHDSGWQAETDGKFDFSYDVLVPGDDDTQPRNSPYEIHPGTIKGLYNIKNIKETPTIEPFKRTWTKLAGDTYIDEENMEVVVPGGQTEELSVELMPVFFDADVEIEGVVQGANKGKVPSKGVLGFVQLAPRGEPLSVELFADLINVHQLGSIGGPLDCTIQLVETKQQMRIDHFDVNTALNLADQTIFSVASRGSVILPKDGSWSMVQHDSSTDDVSPLEGENGIPVIVEGAINAASGSYPNLTNKVRKLAHPANLLKEVVPQHFAFLQSTGTQKVLFRQPGFKKGEEFLKVLASGGMPDLADAYRLANSKAIFPNIQDAIPLDFADYTLNIIEEGYELLNKFDPNKAFEQLLPTEPWVLVDEAPYLKIYIEYQDSGGSNKLDFNINSAVADTGKKWLTKLNDISMVVDLASITRLLIIKGKFNAEKGAEPGFIEPEIKFNETYLQPVIDILVILSQLQGGNYADALSKGLEIAMSNSVESWEYKFSAVKEIPVIEFPSGTVAGAGAPLKLEAGLRVGCYLNQPFKLTSDIEQLVPSAGAFLEFYGRLSVMVVSVGAGTVYATGSVTLGIAADVKLGPSLYMKFGFGAEVVVGLPVIGNVSILFMTGVEMTLGDPGPSVGAFMLFKGRAEILGGIVTVTIMIEAKGLIEERAGGQTNMLAQVTFGLDISICWVINISFSESWEEQRQIA